MAVVGHGGLCQTPLVDEIAGELGQQKLKWIDRGQRLGHRDEIQGTQVVR